MEKMVVGIDISKATIDACIVNASDVQERYHDSFLNKLFGFKQLMQWVNSKESKEVFYCIENTGYYSRSLCDFLKSNHLEFAQVNAAEIKMSMGIKREKSDPSDALMIAMYGIKFPERVYKNTLLETKLLGVQLLLSQRKMLQEKELAFQRSLKLTRHCLPTDKVAKLLVKDNLRHRKYLQKERKKIENSLEEYIDQFPDIKHNYELLKSIPGIGSIIALQTIVQTHNFEQIKCARKFSCYCGVAPFKNESGTSIRKGTRVSFFGHKGLKRILNFGAMNAVKCDPQLRLYYQRKVGEGKSKMSVLNAVRNKLIHRMFATVKRGTPYVIQAVH